MMKSGNRYRLIAANITSASQPCARKKAMNGPTTASKKPRNVQRGVSRTFLSIIGALRFLCKPGRDHSNDHACTVNTVGHAPAYGRCHDKDHGIRSQERKTVAELIGRREEALFFTVVCRFNSPGVDHNVLCR